MFWLCGTVFWYVQNVPQHVKTTPERQAKHSLHQQAKPMPNISQLYRQQETWENLKQNSRQRLQIDFNNTQSSSIQSSTNTGNSSHPPYQDQNINIRCLRMQSIPPAFSRYSVTRSGIHRRLCTRARFQSCLLSSLHSSNQRIWEHCVPGSTCALEATAL